MNIWWNIKRLVLLQPPYPPSPNYYFFLQLKELLKGQWFASSDEVEGAMMTALMEVTKNALYNCYSGITAGKGV